MKKLNGLKYSSVIFNGYTHVAKVEITTVRQKTNICIYTTDSNKDSVENVLLDLKSGHVTSLTITNFLTKEKDDELTRFMLDF